MSDGCDFGVYAGSHHFPNLLLDHSRRSPGGDEDGKPVAGVSGAALYRISPF